MTIQLSLQKEVSLKYLYNPATDEFESLTPTLRDRFALGGGVIQGEKVGDRENFRKPKTKQQVALENSKIAKLKADAKRAKIVGYFKDLEKYIETNAAKYSDVDKFFKDAIKKFDTKKYKDFIIDSARTQRNVRDPKPLGKIFNLQPAYKEGATFNYKNLFGLKGGDASSKVRYVKDMMLINMMEKNPKMINMRDNIIKVLDNDIVDLSEDNIRNTKAFQKQNLKATAARPNLLRSYFNSIIKDFENKRIKVKDVSKGAEADLRNLLKKKDISDAFRKKVRTTLNNIYKGKKYGIELRNEFTKLFGKDKPVYAPTVKKGQESFEFEHKIGKASTGVNKLPATYTLRGTYVPSSFNYAKNINFDNKLLGFMNEYKKTKSAATETKIKNLYKDFNKKSAGYLNDLTIDFDRKAGSVVVTDKTPIFKIKNYDDYKQQFAKNLKHSQAYLSTIKGGKFAYDKKAANELMKKVLPVAGKITMGLGKVIKPLGIITGVAAVTQAANAGETNIVDLAGAYVTGDATTATTNRLLRTDEKFRNDYIANLPQVEGVETEVFDALQKEQDTEPVQTAGLLEESEPVQTAGLLEESGSPYMQFLQGGGQLTPEEFNQLQSIPQSDRPLTGELDLPEMDQTMMAAQGGRVGFQDGTPDPRYGQILSGFKNTDLIELLDKENEPSLKEEVYGDDGERNLLQTFNTMFADPKAIPYYAQKLVRGAANIPEFIASTPKAGYVFMRDLKKNMGITKESVAEIMDILDPEITRDFLNGEYGDLLGISDKAIQASEEKRSGPQRTTGEFLQFVGELPGPATPFFLLGYAPKLLKQLRDIGVTGTAVDRINKEIENKVAQQGVDQTRRDIVLSIGAGAGVGFLKYLGLDFLSKAPKAIAKQVPEMVTTGGTPKYFFDFVNLIKSKGDDITETAATVERQKVYDYKGYTMTEDISSGEIKIYKDSEGGGQYTTPDGELETYDGIMYKEEISYTPRETVLNDKGKPVEVPDIYEESTLKPDMDGDLADVDGGLESIDEILDILSQGGKKYNLDELMEMGINPAGIGQSNLKKILKDPTEINRLDGDDMFKDSINKVKYRSEKAEGGIISGVKSGPPPKSGKTPHGLPYVAKNVRPIKERN